MIGTSKVYKRSITISGTGHALPEKSVTSSELDKLHGYTQGKIEAASGVRQRYFADNQETAAFLASKAIQNALQAANLTISDIDCLVSASATMDQGMPSNAALIHRELGLGDSEIPAFDINASCLGFIAALDTLSWQLSSGIYRHILIVAADLASCGLNWNDLGASAIFGDGAAAAIITPAKSEQASSHILASSLKTYSEGAHYCEIPAGGSRYHPTRIDQEVSPLMKFQMDGKKVFRLTSKHLPNFLDDLLKIANLELEDIDWIVPHQASHLAIQHMIERLSLDAGKVVNIFADYGNQVAASLPTALDIAIRDGRIQRGQRVLLLGTGAGLSIGGIILEY